MIWQPIETAPRDGTSVLVYSSKWFPGTNDCDIAFVAFGVWETLEGMRNMNPTHWMPLPSPPEVKP